MAQISFQARIARKLLRSQFSGWSHGSIADQRARQERSRRFNRLPANVCCVQVSANGIPAEWIEPSAADLGVILYLHGGAYALGSISTHREWIARLARATRTRVLAIDYRLAPEHPFPAALEDAVSAYRWLLAQRLDPAQIIIAGDSAGGGLALSTLLVLRNDGVPLPGRAVCISPWTDLALTGASILVNAELDPILDPDNLRMYAAWYAGNHDLTLPLISPLYADLAGLPPMLIQVAGDEILLDDARRVAAKARAAGIETTLEVWNGMFHVFQLVPFLPETRRAVDSITRFVASSVTPSPPTS